MQSFVRRHWSWNCNDVSVWRGAAAKTECAAIASSFFISVFPQPEKWVGKHSLFLWGCVALSKVHFIYKSKSGCRISAQHRHTDCPHTQTHCSMCSLPFRFTQKCTMPFLSRLRFSHICTHTHTHTHTLALCQYLNSTCNVQRPSFMHS